MKTPWFFMAPLLAAAAIAAEPAKHDDKAAAAHPHQFPGCIPVAQRGGEKLGCFVTANQELGKLPSGPVFWHLYEYPNRAAADGAARTAHGTVVESFGKFWLFHVAAADWNPAGGHRVARVGPLPVKTGPSYTASYMEATFTPGMQSAVHRHAGPEAWYVLSGEQCLETPGHKQVVHAGESGIVEEGPPMRLTGTGTGERRSLVIILHDSSQPMTIPASDWTPAGLCNG